ncbi:hypothetical protein MMC12_004171 [Toensbergia leucococca]|nr:hypothetical protein [Toensbergia leucococca]
MLPATDGQSQKLIAEALVDLESPDDVRISPSGRQVVYTLSCVARKGDYPVSSLWIADVGKEHSARQLTAGLFNDALPQWAPDNQTIAFVSDRAKHGESSAIYLLSLQGGEAYPVSESDNKKPISSFSWSPNGRFIAFLSSDEKTAEKEAQEKEKNDAKLYGEDWEFNRLRCLHVSTREISALYAKDAHVKEFAWSPESTEIAYLLHETPDINSSGYKGVNFERVSLSSRKSSHVCAFPGSVHQLVWSKTDIFFVAGFVPTKSNSSLMIYKLSLCEKSWSKCSYGVRNCARGLRCTKDSVAVQVQSGLSDQIHNLDGSMLYDEIHEISTWDIVYSEEKPILTIAKSSAASPTEIFSVKDGTTYQLSQHGASVGKFEIGNAEPFYCTAKDGTELDGVVITPSKPSQQKPFPAVVLVHGGPYYRVTVSFHTCWFNWTALLVSAGYTVLCPNYRGGSSRGEDFASAARGGMGTVDYDDVICTVKAAISKGLVDEQRVAIGGWSQGGFLSYLAVTRPDFHFQAAVCGAGVSDWDMMSMTSDAPFYEADLVGSVPWETGKEDVRGRRGSAIWNTKDVRTPILILHGEQDARVPVTQAVAFHRGCLHYGVPCEMVTYPREGHMVAERGHVLDSLKRVRRFCDVHLGA